MSSCESPSDGIVGSIPCPALLFSTSVSLLAVPRVVPGTYRSAWKVLGRLFARMRRVPQLKRLGLLHTVVESSPFCVFFAVPDFTPTF